MVLGGTRWHNREIAVNSLENSIRLAIAGNSPLEKTLSLVILSSG
jgi:hypothetical protein